MCYTLCVIEYMVHFLVTTFPQIIQCDGACAYSVHCVFLFNWHQMENIWRETDVSGCLALE